MLGHVAEREDHFRDMMSRDIDYLRKEYLKVETQCFA